MLIVVRPRAGPAGTLMTRPCRRIRFAVHHDANVHLAPREGRSSGWRPRTLLAARLHRRRLGLRCSRCLRHLMLAVHSTQRTPRLLPDRAVATTASAGWVRPQVPEPCWQRSRPRISRHTLDHQESPTRRRCSSSYASWQPKKQSRPNAQRGRARGLDVTPVSVWGCVFIPVTISNASGHHAGTLIAQPVRFTKTPISMLSLLCPAALAEYDKCDRPAGKWAGFDQASKCQSMNQCASAVRLTLAPRLVLCRASAPPEAGRWFTATTTSTLAATGALRPSPPLTIAGIG